MALADVRRCGIPQFLRPFVSDLASTEARRERALTPNTCALCSVLWLLFPATSPGAPYLPDVGRCGIPRFFGLLFRIWYLRRLPQTDPDAQSLRPDPCSL